MSPSEEKVARRPRGRSASHIALVFGLQVAGLAAGFGAHVVIARLMDDAGQYGWVGIGQNLAYVFAALIAFGVPIVAMRRASQLSATGEYKAILALRTMVSGWLWRAVVLGVLPALVLAGGVYAWRAGASSGPVWALLLALLAAPGIAFGQVYSGFARVHGWFGFAVAPDRLWRPLLVVALAVLQWWFWPPLMAVQALLAFAVASVIVSLWTGLVTGRRQRGLARRQPGPGVEPPWVGSLVRTAAPFGLQSVLNVVVRRSDVLLVGLLAGPAAAGIYFAAARIAELLSLPGAAVSTVVGPRYARRWQVGDRPGLQRLVTLSAHASFWPTLAGALVMFAIGEWVLGQFGEDFRAGTDILALLLVSRLVLATAGRLQVLLNMAGAERSVLVLLVATAVLNLVLLLVLISWLGPLGAALAHVLTWSAWVIAASVITRRRLGIRPGILGALRGTSRS